MVSRASIKDYYNLAKPGIIYGNLLTAAAGYLFASDWHNNYKVFLSMMIGLGLIIGCGCVINNVIDRELDRAMERTKQRAIVSGKIKINSAIIYGVALGIIGSLLLLINTNELTFLIAIFGLISYLAFYGYAKRKTVYGTLVGSIAGAIPPLVGYVASTNYIDIGGVVIVFMLITWQLAHFYAISLYRKEDYAAAGIPIWPIIKGDDSTKLQILGLVMLFTIFSLSLFVFGYTGFLYLLIMAITGIGWLVIALRNQTKLKTKAWGRKVFLNSLVVILIMSVALAIGPVAP